MKPVDFNYHDEVTSPLLAKHRKTSIKNFFAVQLSPVLDELDQFVKHYSTVLAVN